MDEKAVPYRLKFSRSYCRYLIVRFYPYYMFHFLVRPYRQSVPAIAYKKVHVTIPDRRRGALYDAMFMLLFDSYAEITGLRLHPATGQALFFLRSAVTCFDDYFEERLSRGTSVELRELLEEPAVRDRMNIFERHVHLFSHAEVVDGYLEKCYADYYHAYVQIFKKAFHEQHFEDILMSAELDSGMGVRLLMEVAALFNGHVLDDEMRHYFYAFGMISKFVDDMIDIIRDSKTGSPNLLFTLIHHHPQELALLETAIQTPQHLNARWWETYCPQTYVEYFAYIEKYYNQIKSPKLRLVSDLVILPAIIGYDFDASRYQ